MLRPITLSWFTVLIAAALLSGAARATTSWAETLAARALEQGPSAQLPPHLAEVLGLASNGQALVVRQVVYRDGFTVRTFNVAAQAPHRMVVTVVDEADKLTTAYLLTPHGHLRRALQYRHGEAPQELPVATAQPAFAAEVRFWSGVAAAAVPAAAH